MKRLLFIIMFLGSLNASASQVVVGLISENLLAWNIWEYRNGELTQQLLLFNKGSQPWEIMVKEKRITSDGGTFGEEETCQTLLQLGLSPGKVVMLPYPVQTAGFKYMEFFENQKRIGILQHNSEKPSAKMVNKKYAYYSNQAINSGRLRYWVGLRSIYDPKTGLGFFHDPAVYNRNYSQLIKILEPGEQIAREKTELKAYKASDKTIIEISKRRKKAAFELALPVADQVFTPVTLFSNHFENDRLSVQAMNLIGIFPEH